MSDTTDKSSKSQRRLRVFLCHSSGDKPAVRDLYSRLQAAGVDAWLDEEDLLPGQNWPVEISKAVRSSDIVIVCLSHTSTTKAGFVQKEIKFALDAAEEQPDGTIFLIPLRLEECDVPIRLQQLHWVDLFKEKGYDRLLRSLITRAKQVSLKTPQIINIEKETMPSALSNAADLGAIARENAVPLKSDHRKDHRRDHRAKNKADNRTLRS